MELTEYLTERDRKGKLETTQMVPSHWVSNTGTLVTTQRLEDVYGIAAGSIEQAMIETEVILYKLTYGHLTGGNG